MKRTVVLASIAYETIRHAHCRGLTTEAPRHVPVAEALRERRGCAVGVSNRESLRLLAALNASGEHLEAGESAGGQRDGLARDRVGRVGWTELERYSVPYLGCAQKLPRKGETAAVQTGGGSES